MAICKKNRKHKMPNVSDIVLSPFTRLHKFESSLSTEKERELICNGLNVKSRSHSFEQCY